MKTCFEETLPTVVVIINPSALNSLTCHKCKLWRVIIFHGHYGWRNDLFLWKFLVWRKNFHWFGREYQECFGSGASSRSNSAQKMKISSSEYAPKLLSRIIPQIFWLLVSFCKGRKSGRSWSLKNIFAGYYRTFCNTITYR